MKQIWQTKGQQWDTAISDSLNEEINNWVAEINSGETFCVPRWYKVTNEAEKKTSCMSLETLLKMLSVLLLTL